MFCASKEAFIDTTHLLVLAIGYLVVNVSTPDGFRLREIFILHCKFENSATSAEEEKIVVNIKNNFYLSTSSRDRSNSAHLIQGCGESGKSST
jgi:hypothetical protein